VVPSNEQDGGVKEHIGGGGASINGERERKDCFKTKKEKIVKGFKNVQTF